MFFPNYYVAGGRVGAEVVNKTIDAILFPIGGWRCSDMFGKSRQKRAEIIVADHLCDARDSVIGLLQEFAGFLQAVFGEFGNDRLVVRLFEQALQIARRNAGKRGNGIERKRFVIVGVNVIGGKYDVFVAVCFLYASGIAADFDKQLFQQNVVVVAVKFVRFVFSEPIGKRNQFFERLSDARSVGQNGYVVDGGAYLSQRR